MCAFPGLRKTSPEALDSLRSVSALLVLDIIICIAIHLL